MPLKHSSPKKNLSIVRTRRKQLERDLEHITQEMYRRNRELAETNQTLSLLRAIDSLVLESQDPLDVVGTQIAQALTDSTDYPLVALLVRSSLSKQSLELCGWSLKNQTLPAGLIRASHTPRVELDGDPWFSSAEPAKLIDCTGLGPKAVSSFFGCPESVAEALIAEPGVRTLYCTKLIVRGKLVGLMVTGFYAELTDITDQDTRLLKRLGEPIGIAIDNRLLFEENRHVVMQLQNSNKKLKALDATKDEFITMASHQLRTPLTSVKGYLSMVLEGDAGKLNKQQTELLTQSFMSSQRMVFLISDLLNLSRLNTGKFVIELAPVDLRDVVHAELDQLRETAKSRSVTMLYDNPEAFPPLLLDVTKIHQVVMNFMDNAIYYTPAGGEITVSLRETATFIEFTVRDNGIGVPRADQHRLFTKFYRAGNARRARPDGTGLGLFMAKKVIVAQGGAIIFDSVEGKGSTFGFRFNKAKHLAPAAGIAPDTPAP